MFKWILPKNWGIIKVYRDFENFADWIKTIKKEQANPKSNFNKWKLSRTKLYDIYLVVSLEDVDLQLPEAIQRTKVIESLNPLHRYFDEELGFADCLNIEFNQYENDKKEPTLSYLIVYRFRFEKFSLGWLFKFLLITGSLTFVILRFDLIPLLITWISNLM